MKKLLSILLVVALLLTFGLFAIGSGSDDSSDSKKSEKASKSDKASENDLGDYTVEIKSCRLAKDYQDKPVVIVTYAYTNVDDDSATSFSVAFDDEAFQNGVGLNKCYVIGDGYEYDIDSQSKDIKKGATIDVEVAYELNDETTPVDVEVKELFSFSDKVISKQFTIE